jgi:hypothetical protein
VPNRGLIDNLPALNRQYLSMTGLVVRAAIDQEPRRIRHAAMGIRRPAPR